ncbi:hypothetical protein [Edaphobacter aggregans]|uniref:hypothetical protein n=1 Tax=Edaphobacter aggregans TaxID=570835 RepID=UPI001FE077D2|nr:hypothetical protein [Edaphobacter aggregans]
MIFESILNRAPPPAIRLNPDIPPKLEEIINKALEKDRNLRYQHALEMRADLQRLKRDIESGRSALAAASMASASVVPRLIGDWRSKRSITLAAILALFAVAIAFSVQTFLRRGRGRLFQASSMSRLTTTGKVTDAAISPDGRYVAHVVDDLGKQSLFVRQIQVARSSNVEIVPPSGALYYGLIFSKDGDYVYYLKKQTTTPWASLCRVAALGGDIVCFADHIDTPISFSTDGKKFAFVRRILDRGESQLVIANSDGSQERVIATRTYPQDFGGDDSGPAWSPDGKIIACGFGDSVLCDMTVVGVNAEIGKQMQLTAHRWFRVGRLMWMPDAAGLVMLGTPRSQFTYQLWFLSYPAGEARNGVSNLWSFPLDGSKPKQLTNFQSDLVWSFTSSPDGTQLAVARGMSASNAFLINNVQ